MAAWIRKDQAAMAKRYTQWQRHTMQVDFWRYVRARKEARARKPHPTLAQRLAVPLAGLR